MLLQCVSRLTDDGVFSLKHVGIIYWLIICILCGAFVGIIQNNRRDLLPLCSILKSINMFKKLNRNWRYYISLFQGVSIWVSHTCLLRICTELLWSFPHSALLQSVTLVGIKRSDCTELSVYIYLWNGLWNRVAPLIRIWFSIVCGNKMPTRCNRGFYCRTSVASNWHFISTY